MLPVTIDPLPCEPLSAVTLTLTSPTPLNAGQEASFEASLSPDNASPPFDYSLDFGDGTAPITGTSELDLLAFTHRFNASGNYTLTLEVTNCGQSLPQTFQLQVEVLPNKTYLPVILNAFMPPPR
jgi:PKD repeat protein